MSVLSISLFDLRVSIGLPHLPSYAKHHYFVNEGFEHIIINYFGMTQSSVWDTGAT